MMKKTSARPSVKAGKVRISGVVRAMNQARRSLSAGLPAGEVERFSQWVRTTLAQVDQICRSHRMKPEQLPAPTYRAYQYLKMLDLKNLPILAEPGRQELAGPDRNWSQRIRIANLASICQGYQEELAQLASESGQKTSRAIPAEIALDRLYERVRNSATQVEQAFQLAGAGPSALPGPSRRAYQWLKFLADGDASGESGQNVQARNLRLHLSALQKVNRLLQPEATTRSACLKELPAAHLRLPVGVQFYNVPVLYRIKTTPDAFQLVASEGFINAPNEVLAALLCAALLHKRARGEAEESLRKVRRFADSQAYTDLLQALELEDQPGNLFGRGRHFDLEAVFGRVNAAYFQSHLPRPRLTWNQTLTRHKLGHYQPATDTIMVSISLDHPEVPEYVIDFVMYHEMLHKKLGILENNGRYYAHTREFRAAEQEFQQYLEAQEFLRQIGQGPA